jgi:hypothetical protein
MIKKLVKSKLFIVLIFLAIILLIIKLNSTKQTTDNPTNSDQQISTSVNISQFQSPDANLPQNQSNNPNLPTPTIKITEINYQIPLYNLLPYQGKYFKAIRYFKTNNIQIKVFNREHTDLAKKEAQEWLVKNRVDNLDTFTVIY